VRPHHVALATAVLVVFAGPPAQAATTAGTLDAWTAPAKVASIIGPCAKPVGDDPPSKATPCSTKFVDACSHANGDSTLSISQCAEAAAVYWRDIVTQRTAALEKLRVAAITKYVQSSDAAWKRYLTTRCSMYGQFEGTINEILSAECVLDTTIQRADDLDRYASHASAQGVQ